MLPEIAETYKDMRLVDDASRWAPYDCRLPDPGRARFSESGDRGTHGRKLYVLYVKDLHAYRSLTEGDAAPRDFLPPSTLPVELQAYAQVIVKESRQPQTTPGATDGVHRNANQIAPAERDGVAYYPGERTGLFIMAKLPDDTPGTDQGWVYGTLTADGRTVTSAGRVQNCMNCHQDAPHGRLFGLAGDGE